MPVFVRSRTSRWHILAELRRSTPALVDLGPVGSVFALARCGAALGPFERADRSILTRTDPWGRVPFPMPATGQPCVSCLVGESILARSNPA